jgi:leucyl aminopeptidase
MQISFQKVKKSSNKTIINVHIIANETNNKIIELAKNNPQFNNKPLQMLYVSIDNSLELIINSGNIEKLNLVDWQKIGGKIVAALNAGKYQEAIINLHLEASENDLANLAFGAKLQSYVFNKYFAEKQEEKKLSLQDLTIITSKFLEAKKQFTNLEILANNIYLVRDLVSEPSNKLDPEIYAKFCSEINVAGLEIEILDEKQMQKLGMNALLGVGKGSEKKSQLVILKWMGGKKNQAPLAFVGKGVTFDTGGISIKPSNNMEDMKTDMAGSAVVIGLLKNLAERKAKVNAVGVVGLVENMPSGTAQKPGDVVVSMSKQTIEVINTDAEGRLVLADALYYTKTKFKPQFIVDLATLTGAIIVSLADCYAGLFSNNDDLAKNLQDCGLVVGEKVWRLPLGEEYDEMINSDIADMKNVGSGRGAGSITAAQFLQRFIGDTPWAHLDIAGVSWKGKGDVLAKKGATGFGVQLLNALVTKYEN